MSSQATDTTIFIGGVTFPTSRPHGFGLVVDRPSDAASEAVADDYLHEILLTDANRGSLLSLIETEGLIVCRNVHSTAPTYRKVRGKSSVSKLSQAEYYHHDGCSAPTKPRVVEIRCPHQAITRNIATAIAPLPAVIRAMVMKLPDALVADDLVEVRERFAANPDDYPAVETWDSIQGKVTRLARRELDAESCRQYFRQVDEMAGAYVLPWEMGESRLMLNSHADLTRTMQHRRAYQKPRLESEQNGSLVKRWPAEEVGDCKVCS
ncbi:hypothetical protein [Rubripirellula reticaptiva]|uniref:Uncharacterized protein n=1 Tax=Rubripirellula reticaptiva TaxID=2528013 RepID=A0A5C6EGL2_9BACT|nr:hypothetical protein [Rubripirellula reticaptiva]TWU46726.1 hypothetical protein Poly59_56990 [Rubripirellula reticaptiva]